MVEGVVEKSLRLMAMLSFVNLLLSLAGGRLAAIVVSAASLILALLLYYMLKKVLT